MNNFKQAIDIIREGKYALSNNTIKQDIRNKLKGDILQSLLQDIGSLDSAVVGRTDKGILVAIDSELGYIPVYLNVVISSLKNSEGEDFDPQSEFDYYTEKINKKREKVQLKLEKSKGK